MPRPTVADGRLVTTYLRWLAAHLVIPPPPSGVESDHDMEAEDNTEAAVAGVAAVHTAVPAAVPGGGASSAGGSGAGVESSPPAAIDIVQTNQLFLEAVQAALAHNPGADLRPLLGKYLTTCG